MMNLLINYALIHISIPTKCHYNFEGHGTSQIDDVFGLSIEYTPLHTHPHLTPRMGMFVAYIR